jgi:outer membrane protein OmpA-like peptidoglycan-associated protein
VIAAWRLRLIVVTLTTIAAATTTACGRKRPAVPAAPAATLVVLLPDADSATSSRIVVSNAAGAVELVAPLDTTTVSTKLAPTPPAKMSDDEVTRQFAAVLADLPTAAQRFNLHFRIESSELTDQARALVPAVLQAVRQRPGPDVTVIGHTDTTGTSGNNYRLGLQRAMAVRDLLLKAGLDAALVEVESHGEADLFIRTRNNTAEPRNRRVEITVK